MDVKLDIINAMLAAIGSSGISSTVGRHPGLIKCEPVVDRTNRSIQARGHWFNTDWGLTLLPTVEGEFILPQSTMKADTTNKHEPYVRRGRVMYDPTTHTSLLEVPSMTLDVVILLDYEDLPQAAIDLIQARAILEVVSNSNADAITLKSRQTDLNRANMAFETQRLSQADYSIRSNPNYARIVGRGYSRNNPSNIGG